MNFENCTAINPRNQSIIHKCRQCYHSKKDRKGGGKMGAV